MSDITIPPEALEAAARAVHDIDRKIAGEDQWPAWEDISPTDKQRRLHRVRAALLAGLKAWPGMKKHKVQVPDDSDEVRYTLKTVGIVLPLTENTNAET